MAWAWQPNNRAHNEQFVLSVYRSGNYCVDQKARLRWRVSKHKSIPQGEVLLAPEIGIGFVNFPKPYGEYGLTMFAVLWP